MALNKRQYTDGQTIITAANLNEIQDCIIAIEGSYVPKTRTVAGKALSSNITLAASDVGAVPTSRTINSKALTGNITLSAADVGAVPVSRTVNSKALSSNITLNYADVGAVPSTREVNGKALSDDITITALDIGAVPTSRTINSKALTSNITLSAADVSAVPTTRTINNKALSSDITLAAADIGYNSTNVGAELGSLNGAVSDLNGVVNDEKTKMPYLNGTTATSITVANGTAANPNNTSAVHTVEQIPIKTGQVATVKVLRTPKVSGDKFVFGSAIRNSAGELIIFWDYNANAENRCSVKCDVPIIGGYVQFTIAESNGSTYTTLRSTDFTSGDVVISVEDANTLPEYSESFSPTSFTADRDLDNVVKVKICSYNVAKYNCDTTIPMSDEKVLNFRKFLDAFQFDYLCVQEDMHYYDNSSKDALNYLYYPILPEYYRAGINYDINIHCCQLAVGTSQKVMFTGVSSKSRAMQVCAFPIEGSNKKLLVCSVHCPYADKGGSYDSAENIALRNSVYQEIFKFINGDIQLNNVAGTAVSVPAHDYAVVCMDANCMTSTDKSNLLSAASAKNFKGANGGKFGWFNTCYDADKEYALDNIFVSSNIEFSKIEPLWSWFDDLYSDHVPLIADLLLVNAKTIYDCGTTPSWNTVSSGSYLDVSVSFNKTFASAPTVICSMISDSSSTDIGSIEAVVYSTTTSGATIRIYNNSGSTRSPKVSWIAIGT